MALRGSVARRYARALFSIGLDQANFEQLGRELDALASLYESSRELREAMQNPVFKATEKRAILEKILPRVAPSRLTQNFVLLLVERNRIGLLPQIPRA